MAKKTSDSGAFRPLEIVRKELQETDVTAEKIRKLFTRTMATIRSRNFRATFIDQSGQEKLHPALKRLRELESTLRSAEKHAARLRSEEAKILKSAAAPASRFSEFKMEAE